MEFLATKAHTQTHRLTLHCMFILQGFLRKREEKGYKTLGRSVRGKQCFLDKTTILLLI